MSSCFSLIRWRRKLPKTNVAIRVLIGVSSLSLLSTIAFAAPPKLTGFYPPGAARGQKVVVQAAGELPKWPVEFRIDRPGVTATAASDKGKVDVQVAPDAIPGVYWLRAIDDEGASSPKPFLVGTIREVDEVEPNDSVDKGQAVELPATVNGKVGKAGDVDGFVVQLKKGQPLIAALSANSPLGSPMDAVLQIAELVGGVEPASGSTRYKFARRAEAYVLEHSDDETGYDPRITIVAPRDGRYLVRVFAFPTEPNSTIGYAGGDNYVYRLTLTSGPFVDVPLPLVRSSAAAPPTAVALDGRADSTPHPVELSPPLASEESLDIADRSVSWAYHPAAAGAVAVGWTSAPSVVAGPEALTPAGQPLAFPTVVTGVLPQRDARATFRVTLTKGQKWNLRVDARVFGFPLDPHLAVLDANGKQVTENDDANNQRDSQLSFTAPADGAYSIVVRDVHGYGGGRYAYRLTVELATPQFGVTVTGDSFTLTAGKPLEIPLAIDRREGFAEELEFQIEGLPAGVTLAPIKSEAKGDSAKAVKLTLNADPAAVTAVVHAPLRIVARSAGDAAKNVAPQKRVAGYTVPGVVYPLREVWLTVAPETK